MVRVSDLSKEQLDLFRQVWENLAGYLNADLTSDEMGFEKLGAAIRQLRMLVRLADALEFILPGSENDSFRNQSTRYQGELRNLLRWLCKPRSYSELRIPALRFLDDSAHSERRRINLDHDCIGTMNFDEQMGKSPVAYFSKRVEYESVIGPICKFIFDTIDPPPVEGLPIRICKREGCGKFFVHKRSPKRYCSDSCRAQDHQNNDEVRDYQYLRRLEKIDDRDLLKIKLRSPAVQNRLAGIEVQWPDWAIEKIRRIKER